jgi:sulfonate transport system permease protein
VSVRLGRAGRLALKAGAIGLILPALLLALWDGLARFGVAPANLLPAPLAVLRSLRGLTLTGELWTHIEITLLRVAEGFLLGTAVATLLGALTGYSSLWRRLLDPTLQALRSIPSIAWVPLFVLWLGISEQSKVTLIAVGAFFPVYLSTMAGIQQVDRKLVEVARIHGYGGVQLVRRVLLPATLPAYMTGLRGGLGLAWMFVVAAEYLGASEGLGFLLIDGQETGRPANIIAAILLFAVFGKASDMALAAISRRFVAWQDSFESAEEKKADAADPARLQEV